MSDVYPSNAGEALEQELAKLLEVERFPPPADSVNAPC